MSSHVRVLGIAGEVVSIPLIAPDYQMPLNKVPLLYQSPLIFSSVASDTHREEGMKDQKKIRLGLIGVGNWALFAHVRVLGLLPEYEIVAIYSQRKEAAKAAATEYGIPHVAESLDAVVSDPVIDHVLALTTSQQHEEGIRAAITAGK